MSKSITSLNFVKSRYIYVVDVALTDLTKLLAPSRSLYVRNKSTLNFLSREKSIGSGHLSSGAAS